VKEEFREGNEHPGARAVGFLEDCRKALPSGKMIGHLGSDSALYQAGVINCCRENHITFTIRADQDSAVKKAIEGIPDGDLRPFYDRDGIKTAWLVRFSSMRYIWHIYPCLRQEDFSSLFTRRGIEVLDLHKNGRVCLKSDNYGFKGKDLGLHFSLRVFSNSPSFKKPQKEGRREVLDFLSAILNNNI